MASSSARLRLPGTTWMPLLLVAALLAGCAGPSPADAPPPMGPYTPRPGSEPDVRCQDPAPALVHLELHSDHSVGESVYWAVYPDGTALLARGPVTYQANETRVWGPDADAGLLQRLCTAMAAHARPGWHGDVVHHGLQVRIVVERQVDLDALHRALEAFWDLPADSSLMCRSGADSWMQANLDGQTHSVEARCAPTEAFRDVREKIVAAVGEEPFSGW